MLPRESPNLDPRQPLSETYMTFYSAFTEEVIQLTAAASGVLQYSCEIHGCLQKELVLPVATTHQLHE